MCELACSLEKTGSINPYLARIQVVPRRDESHGRVPVICRHCRPAPCRAACPIPGAMKWDESLGVASVDPSACTQCLACVDACPFGAIAVGPGREILKCDLCQGDPMCVSSCPPRPENSLPHLPLPRQSCLQYVPHYMVGRNSILVMLERGRPKRAPSAQLEKRYQLAPQFAKEVTRYEKRAG